MTMHDHRRAIPDQDRIHIGFLHDACRGVVIAGQHDNLFPARFEGLEIENIHELYSILRGPTAWFSLALSRYRLTKAW